MAKTKKLHIVWVSRGPNSIYLNLCRALSDPYQLTFLCRRATHLLSPPQLVDSFNFVTVPYYNNLFNPLTVLHDSFLTPAPYQQQFVYYRGLTKYLDNLRPDLIIANGLEQPAVWQAAAWAQRRRLPYILQSETQRWPSGPLWRQLGGRLLLKSLRHLIHHALFLWTWTDQGRDFGIRHILTDPEQVRTIPAAIDTDLFRVVKKPARDGILKLSLVSRFVVYKRHQDAILAVHYLRHKLNQRVQLDIIGTDPLGKEATGAAIRTLVKRLRLEANVKFCARRTSQEMPNFYGDHDLNLLTSEYEPIGLVVPESMACGTPNIVSDTTGAKMYLIAGQNGYTYRTGNWQDLAHTILKLTALEQRHQFGVNAANHIKHQYSLPTVSLLIQQYLTEKLSAVQK